MDLSGFVGSLVLVGGDPGAGKSTLLLQVKYRFLYFYSIVILSSILILCSYQILHLKLKIAAIIAEGHDDRSSPVVYVSGEEVSVSWSRFLFLKLCYFHILLLIYLLSNFCLVFYFTSLFISYVLFESLKLVGRKKGNGRNLKFSWLVCLENYEGNKL